MNKSAQEALTQLQVEIVSRFRQIEQICDDNKLNFSWPGLTDYGTDSADYYYNGTWHNSSMSC